MPDIGLLLSESEIWSELRQAWLDSEPGIAGAHEEGGFIVVDTDGQLDAVRWPRGSSRAIRPTSHPECRIGRKAIVLSFHTHPNTGREFLQGPSRADVRAVRDDPDLKGSTYLGEIVISVRTLYLIRPDGSVAEIGDTLATLRLS